LPLLKFQPWYKALPTQLPAHTLRHSILVCLSSCGFGMIYALNSAAGEYMV